VVEIRCERLGALAEVLSPWTYRVMQHFLYLVPLPHGHAALRLIFRALLVPIAATGRMVVFGQRRIVSSICASCSQGNSSFTPNHSNPSDRMVSPNHRSAFCEYLRTSQ
jgi:hypothetical protein